jgi:hypothetical protein
MNNYPDFLIYIASIISGQVIKGRNLEIENGVLAATVQALKKIPGRDILVHEAPTL